MDFNDAAKMVNELMAEHGMTERGITWRWAKGIKVMGHFSPSRREIALYRPFTSMATEEQVRATVLHEIAHALSPSFRDPWTRRWVRHGEAWRAKCLEIGGNGERCGANPYYSAVKSDQHERIAANSPTVSDMVRVQSLRVGDMATIVMPNSKWDGFTGRIVTVTEKKIHIQSPQGKLMAPKSIMRPA